MFIYRLTKGWLKLSILLLLSACGHEPPSVPETQTPRPVRTQLITDDAAIEQRSFSGVVDANRKADLAFRVPGKLLELLVREGDHVSESQILARLDPTDYQLSLNGIEAEHERALAEYKRGSKLVEKNLISRSDHDKLKSQFATAQTALLQARQAIEYTELKAPFDGFVSVRYVENFSEVSAGLPILAVVDVETMIIAIDVPESVMVRVRREVGKRLKPWATLDGVPEARFPLTFKEVSTQADPVTRTYRLTYNMDPGNQYNILPGMSAQVHFHRPIQGFETNYIYVPAHAVLKDSTGNYVFVAQESASGKYRVKRRTVTVAGISELGIQVNSGLEFGDRLITAGMSRLVEDMPVTLTDTEIAQ